MSKTQYVDMDGVENVAVGIVRQAKKDFIKGGKILYRLFGYIPTEEEFTKSIHRGSRTEPIRQMFDAWRFVIQDPYDLFESAGKETTINQWKLESIITYYYDGYVKGAEELYYVMFDNLNVKNVKPYALTNYVLNAHILNTELRNAFMKARDYILNLSNGEKILDEWNVTAYEHARKRYKKGGEKKDRTETIRELAKKRNSDKLERIKKAKELWSLGLTMGEIAEKLGVTKQSVNKYLKDDIITNDELNDTCPCCGSAIDEDWNFCNKCGTKLS